MVLDKPGLMAPALQPHRSDDPACARPLNYCGAFGIVPPSAPGRRRIEGRDVRIQMFADELSGLGNLGRTIVNETGLASTFDFSLEWTPDSSDSAEPSGPNFLEALKEQLGVKLEPRKAPVNFLVLDHVEKLSEN